MVQFNLVTLTLFNIFSTIRASENDHNLTTIPHCLHSHNVNNNRCNNKSHTDTTNHHADDCHHVKFCRKEFNLLRFNIEPYSSRLEDEIQYLINLCCEHCNKHVNVINNTNATLTNFTLLKEVDFIFPVLAKVSGDMMINEFYFIPLLEVPETYYVRRRRSGTETAADILFGLVSLWPLLGIGILLALFTGLLVWFIETWKYPKEFPRDFAPGVFEGFWWSLVTMATVGYGDRVPATYQGRTIAILWMIVGIVITNVLTAEVTRVVIEKKTAPTFDMTGSTIGVLNHRLYDATSVARAGGHVHVINESDTIKGMTSLLNLVVSEDKKIDGFLIDKFSYYFYWHWSNKPGNGFGKDLLYQTIRTVKEMKSKEFNYGLLVKRQEDLNHLKHYFTMNWFQVETCLALQINSLVGDLLIFEDHENFPPDDGFRDPWLSLSIFIVLFVCAFGICYDLVRRHTSVKKSHDISIKKQRRKHFFKEESNGLYKS